jgi:hypothetical protein
VPYAPSIADQFLTKAQLDEIERRIAEAEKRLARDMMEGAYDKLTARDAAPEIQDDAPTSATEIVLLHKYGVSRPPRIPMKQFMESGPGIARHDTPPTVIDYSTWLDEIDLIPDWERKP